MLKYIIILLISVTFISCRDKDCETLTTKDLEWVPYIFQNQKLTFINTSDTTDTLFYTVKIYPPQQNELKYDYWHQSDNVCGEAIYIEYVPSVSPYLITNFSIYRAYNQMGLNTTGSGGIAGGSYKEIGFNAGIFYKIYKTKYHTFNDVYKYVDYNDTIWYAKKYGFVKIYNYYFQKLFELKI